MIYFLAGGVTVAILAVLLVWLIPGKAVKFAVKLGSKLEAKIGSANIALLRGLAEKL